MTDRTYFTNARPEMQALVPQAVRRVLEIGCGDGVFAATLSGTETVWGIEPDPEAADNAAGRLTRVLRGTFEEVRAELPLAGFDVVICNDVIEHMDDHDRFLAEIQPYIAPGGVIVGSVPNVRYFRNLCELLVLGDWHYRDSGILDRTHKRFFTLRSLRRSLEQAGLRVEVVKGINNYLSPQFSRHAFHYTLFGYGLLMLSLGRAADIRCMQLGFRAAKV